MLPPVSPFIRRWITRSLLGGSIAYGAIFFVGCSSLPLHDSVPAAHLWPPAQPSLSSPSQPSSSSDLPTSPASTRWLALYRQAQVVASTDPALACSHWVELSLATEFPLQRLSTARAVEICPLGRTELPQFVKKLETFDEPWLKETSARALVAYSRRVADHLAESKWTYQAATLSRSAAEQLQLFERAKNLAQNVGDNSTASKAQTEIERLAPRKIPSPTTSQLPMVASDFQKAREFERAREIYQRIVSQDQFSEMEKLKALDGIRSSYKLQNEREKFIDATRAYARFTQQTSSQTAPVDEAGAARYLETHLALARAIWTENRPDEAMSILEQLEKELSGRHPIEEILFIRARIHEERDHLEASLKVLNSIDEQKVTNRALRLNILWYRAWINRKAGRHQEAASTLESLIKKDDSPAALARYRYWLARSFRDLGRDTEARAAYDWLIENDPIGYYGLLAHRDLKLKLPKIGDRREARSAWAFWIKSAKPPAEPRLDRSMDTVISPQERLTFEWLVALDEKELARAFLNHSGALRGSNADMKTKLKLYELQARAGAYQALFASLIQLPPPIRRELVFSKPEIVFPRPWLGWVEAAARKSKIEPALVYSIMRQESSFNPFTRSHADAFGLMQLIPEMSSRAAQLEGLELSSIEDLYKPEINIRLGTRFLRETFDKWGGRFIPAVASYNASDKAVAGWLKTRYHEDPIRFIEDIPYEETRTYVKLVMRNYVFYNRLTTEADSIEFPEWCLAGLQAPNS